jgi:DNA-binding transcriptional ArsR family regulator
VGNITASFTGVLLYNALFIKGSAVTLANDFCRTFMIPQVEQDMVVPVSHPLITRDEDIDRASRSLKAMSHPLRLKILCTLGEQEVSVQDIVENVGTSQSNISQHLAILRDKGILASRKDANRVYYRVSDSRTLRLISMMREVFCTMNSLG